MARSALFLLRWALVSALLCAIVAPAASSAAPPPPTPTTHTKSRQPVRPGGDAPRDAPQHPTDRASIMSGATTVTYALPKVTFRVDDGYDLDQYLYRGSSPIDFAIDLQGFAVDPARQATITLRVFDVDQSGSGSCAPEVDRVLVNGTFLGTLTGATDQWSIVTFSAPGSALNSGVNNFQVEIDTLATDCWAVEVDSAEVAIDFNIAQLEASGLDDVTITRGTSSTVISDPIWKTSFDASGNPITPASPDDPLADSFSGAGTLTYRYLLGAWPTQPSWDPEVDYHWEWNLPGAIAGGGTLNGWDQQFSVFLPSAVGKYTLRVTLAIKHDGQLLRSEIRDHTVYVLFDTPPATSGTTGGPVATGQPKTAWLDLATDWAAGQSTNVGILDALNTREYSNPLGWGYGYPKEGPVTLIESGAGKNGDCFVFRDVWRLLAGVLGIPTSSTQYVPNIPNNYFITSLRPALDGNASASARNQGSGTRDRWIFGNHQYGLFGGTFYDPTFGLKGSNTTAGKESNVVCKGSYPGDCAVINPPGRTVPVTPAGIPDINGWQIMNYNDGGVALPFGASGEQAAQASAGSLTGSNSDTGADLDGNGLFEHLRLNVGVQVTQAGSFGFLAELRDSQGNLIALGSLDPDPLRSFPQLSTNLSTGTQSVPVYFSGAAIRQAGVNGPYTVALTLTGDTGTTLDTDSISTGSYSAAAFQGALAVFQGVSDSGVNSDGVTGFETLRVTAQLDVAADADLTVEALLFAGDTYLGSSTQSLSLSAGTQPVQFDFAGAEIAAAGVNGPYTVYLAVNDGTYTDSAEHTTAAYTVSQFQPPAAIFSGTISDSGNDTNGNSRYETLDVQASITARTPGTYTVYGRLQDGTGNTLATTIVTAQVELANGTAPLALAFDGLAIGRAQVDGPYQVLLALADSNGADLATRSHTTAAYDASDFERPGALLQGSFSETALDGNGDSLYELLQIGVGVDASAAGIYHLSGDLFDSTGVFIANAQTDVEISAAGIYTPNLEFAGGAISTHGVDGPYRLGNLLLTQDGLTLDSDLDAYTTQPYEADDFQLAGLLTGSFADQLEDTNANGLAEFLVFEFGVSIDTSATYSYNARLVDSNGVEIGWASDYAYLTPGSYTRVLRFTGPSIRENGVDGPYFVKDLSVYSDFETDTRINVHTTAAYDAAGFEITGVVRGTVTAAGQPVSGATVTVNGVGSDITDSAGIYRIELPSTGTYTISISAAATLAPWRILANGSQVAQGTSASFSNLADPIAVVDFVSAAADPQCPPQGNDLCVYLGNATVQTGEAAGSVTINATLTATSTTTVQVTYATSNGTATAGSDYTTTNGTLTFAPGELTKTISVPIREDTADEPDETFTLRLSGSSQAVIGAPGSTVVTITDNDQPPTVAFNPTSYSVGENAGSATVTARLSAASGYTVTVEYNTSDGTATAGSDYTATSGTLTFAPGQTSRTFAVPILEDALGEVAETVNLALSSPTNATLGTAAATLTIPANDVLTFNLATYSVGENGGSLSVQVRLSASSAQTVTVEYSTSDATATAGSDYTATSGTVTFAPGQTSRTFTVPILEDGLSEGAETFGLALSNPSGAVLGTPSSAVVTITANDLLTLNSATYSVGENGGSLSAIVRLSASSAQTVTVQYSTSDATASAGSDYTATSGTVTFAPGQTNQTVTVPILEDGLGEVAETFGIALSNPSGAGLGTPSSAVATINANDLLTLSASSYSAGENAGSLLVTVRLSAASAQPVTVDYSTSDTTASAGSDYTATSGTLTFAPGQTTQTFTVPILEDGLGEVAETFGIALSNPSGASLGTPNSAVVTITANDLLTLNSATYSVGENTSSISVQVRLSATSAQTVTVQYSTSDTTATAGSDYTATSGTLTFAPGQTTQTFTVPILEDGLGEVAETFGIALSNPSGASLGTPNSAVATITANDLLTLNSATYSVGENGGSLSVQVRLSAASAQPVTVQYSTSDTTATAGSDYTATSGTLTFAPGQTNLTFTVPILEDGLGEGAETFSIVLSNPSGASLGTPNSAVATITANDLLTLNAATYSVGENGGSLSVQVRLSATSAQTVTVQYSTSDTTATAGSDYTATSGTVTFAPGQTTQTVTVPILEDGLSEVAETFGIALSNPSGASLGTPNSAVATITANDVLTLNAATYSVGENGGSLSVQVRLSVASAQTVTVDYSTSDGTATAGSDYTATSGTVTFTPGQTTQTVTVPILEDGLGEGAETFSIVLSNPSGAGLGTPSSATATIAANDLLTFSSSSYSVNESNGTVTISVRLSVASAQTVTVDYATGGGTASAGSDYTATSGTLTFAPGQTNLTFTVPITNDTTDEPNETVTLTLSNPSGATLGTPNSATLTIVDND